jgi:DNA polymerase-3 subunit gamma/tau
MTGATSPRLHLELMAARVLVPAVDDSERGALARVERLERRIGVEGAPATVSAAPTALRASTNSPRAAEAPAAPPTSAPAPAAESPAAEPRPAAAPIGEVSFAQVKDAWPEILEEVKRARLNAWMVVYTAQPLELRDGKTLVLSFPSQNDVDALKQPASPGQGVGDLLKKAFQTVLGLEPALIARVDAAPAVSSSARPTPNPPADAAPDPVERDSAGWAVTAIPGSEPEAPAQPKSTKSTAASTAPPSQKASQPASTAKQAGKAPAQSNTPAPANTPAAANSAASSTAPASTSAQTAAAQDAARYGESVVRELLGASFIEEQPVTPRVVPRAEA